VYRTLNADRILETIRRLRARVTERFPDSSLSKIASELVSISEEANERCRTFLRPNLWLRAVIAIFLAMGAGGIVMLLTRVKTNDSVWLLENFLEECNSALGIIVFMGMAVAFLLSVEVRLNRKRALAAINELRAISHIIDMHQLTKDPEYVLRTGPRTPSSPVRTMSSFELSRYFDYCSEMLAIVAKIAALYVQQFPDAVVLNAVDDVEEVTSGLSHKIWQKITLLDRFIEREEELAGRVEKA
jgi:hypothetical protein